MVDQSRIQLLSSRYIEGLATTSEVAELQQQIVEDPAAADIFVRLSRFDSLLLEVSHNNRSAREALRSFEEANDVVDRAISDVGGLDSLHGAMSRPTASGAFQTSTMPGDRRARSRRRIFGWVNGWRKVGLATAVALLMIGGLIWFVPGSTDLSMQLAQQAPSPSIKPSNNSPTVPPSSPIAVVTQVIGARFSGSPVAPVVGDQFRIGLYQLTSGIIELTFDQSPAVILEAPCEFDLRGRELLVLHRGRISARVPMGAGEFKVETPSATVFDQGTEFGLQVDDKQDCEVHVFNGKVSVTPRLSDPLTASVLRDKTASIIGKNSSTPCGIDVDSDRFLRSLKEPESEYARLVLEWAPALYFRMLPAGGIIEDAGPNHVPGYVIRGDAKGTPWTVGRIGSALQFGGPAVKDYAVVPEYPKATDGRLTVAAWIFAKSRPRSATIAMNWAENESGQFRFGLNHDSGELQASIMDGDRNVVTVKDSKPLTIGKWQHVALVADGTTLKLFRNGLEIGSNPCSGAIKNPGVSFMGIGAQLDGEGKEPYAGGTHDDDSALGDFWHGRIDELSVFNHPLNAEQIQRLFDSAESD